MSLLTWALWGLAGGIVLVGVIYVVGGYLLRREGYTFPEVPLVYDGKGSYETWAQQMEEARRLQAQEEKE